VPPRPCHAFGGITATTTTTTLTASARQHHHSHSHCRCPARSPARLSCRFAADQLTWLIIQSTSGATGLNAMELQDKLNACGECHMQAGRQACLRCHSTPACQELAL
jgi:hypothetical protein